MARILVVDDEAPILKALRQRLMAAGHEVVVASDGNEALMAFERYAPDLVVLDVMLPGMDGYQVCRWIRERSTVPVIMLTARSDELDRLEGFWLGADDYITKPFSLAELTLRVAAVLRRASPAEPPAETPLPQRPGRPAAVPPEAPLPRPAEPAVGRPGREPLMDSEMGNPAGRAAAGNGTSPHMPYAAPSGTVPGVLAAAEELGGAGDTGRGGVDPEVLHFEGLTIDRRRRLVFAGPKRDTPVEMTAREFDLLWLLASHPMVVFSREQILDRLWQSDYPGDLANVTVCISRLRSKLGDDAESPHFIQTVRGVGYRFGARPLRPQGAVAADIHAADIHAADT